MSEKAPEKGEKTKVIGLYKKILPAAFLLSVTIMSVYTVFALSSEAPPTVNTSLGVWINMPFTATELMGNVSYRSVVVTDGAVILNVFLSVGCIVKSNTVGAQLQLQYANYTGANHSNSSNFVNIGGSVPIDNSAGWPCPGELTQLNAVSLTHAVGLNTGWVFRAVGSGGGGVGDNPRFSHVSVVLRILLFNVPFGTNTVSASATGFTAVIYRAVPAYLAAVTVNFNWIAVNSTVSTPTQESGPGSCTMAQGIGSSNAQCTQVIPFPTAFAATPNIFLQTTTVPPGVIMPLGTLDLLKAQTLTV